MWSSIRSDRFFGHGLKFGADLGLDVNNRERIFDCIGFDVDAHEKFLNHLGFDEVFLLLSILTYQFLFLRPC